MCCDKWQPQPQNSTAEPETTSFRITSASVQVFVCIWLWSWWPCFVSPSFLHPPAPPAKMPDKTDSDVESDEEFEGVLSSTDWLHQLERRENLPSHEIVLQLSKKRLDRVEKLVKILVDFHRTTETDFIRDFLRKLPLLAFEYLPIGQCAQAMRMFFDPCGELLADPDHYFGIARLALIQALFYKDEGSVNALRELRGNSFVEEIASAFERERSRNELCSLLFWASVRGDIVEVERLLALNITRTCKHFDESCCWIGKNKIEASAQHGHIEVVEALFRDLERRKRNNLDGLDVETKIQHERMNVFFIACRRGSLTMAMRMLSACAVLKGYGMLAVGPWSLFQGESVLNALRVTPEFLKGLLSALRKILHKAGRQMDRNCLNAMMIKGAIELRQRRHVEILLDEVDKDASQYGRHFAPQVCKRPPMSTVLKAKSTRVLRMMLERYPEALDSPICDPLRVMRYYNWPAGARLLLEAGAEVESIVPPVYINLMSLSLEDRCRIAARRCIKPPLSQNLERLPLPEKLRRRFLYRY